MSTVDKREWLDYQTGETERDDTAAALDEHTDDGQQHGARPSPASSGRRAYRHTSRGTNGRLGPVQGAHDPVPAREPLPGGRTRIESDPVPPVGKLDVGEAEPYYSGMMAHGVPAEPEHGGRPAPKDHERSHARPGGTRPAKLHVQPDPIPVEIVERGKNELRRASFRRVAVQAANNVDGAQQVVGRDPKRDKVRLLNESATVGIRLGFGPSDAVGGASGAYLPPLMTTYQDFDTQDYIFAIADSGTTQVFMSVVFEYSIPEGTS